MMVFCDNYGCMFIDECGFCNCDKLNIVGGVCEGSYHSGRNATDNEPDCIEDKSRWFGLFGTPEKVAHMLPRALVACSDCILEDECIKRPDDASCLVDDEATLLEWLRGKAVER